MVVVPSNFLQCKQPQMQVHRDKEMIFSEEEAPLDTTGNPPETLKATGETNPRAKLQHKINRAQWATSKVNSSKVVSNPVTAIADP